MRGNRIMSPSGQKRQVNKADGMSDSPPIASGLPHCRFARGEHNASGTRFIASWMHEHARSVYAAIRG
jgi:hypothetical protein